MAFSSGTMMGFPCLSNIGLPSSSSFCTSFQPQNASRVASSISYSAGVNPLPTYWIKVHISTLVPFFCCTMRRSSILPCERLLELSHNETISILSGSPISILAVRTAGSPPAAEPPERNRMIRLFPLAQSLVVGFGARGLGIAVFDLLFGFDLRPVAAVGKRSREKQRRRQCPYIFLYVHNVCFRLGFDTIFSSSRKDRPTRCPYRPAMPPPCRNCSC